MASDRSVHVVVSLDGSVQSIPLDGRCRWMSLQPGTANANPVYIGGAGLTTSSCGVRLPASVAGEPPAPHVIGEFNDGSVYLSDLYVRGTNGEKLHIHALVYV